MDSLKKANIIANLIEEKKGLKIETIKMDEMTILTDYFIVASGTSVTHVKALAKEVREKLWEGYGLRCSSEEGADTARWVLLDYQDVVVHIFHPEEREFYNLERLWKDFTATVAFSERT